MNELETYIRAHAAGFDTEAPATGHAWRFRAKLRKTRPAPSYRALAFALAAFAAALLVLRPSEPRDFRFVPDDPEAIYLAYMDQVAGLYGAVPAGNSAAWDATMQEITEEGVPLFEQLPDELSRREQARILKAYYSELLNGARQLTKSTK
jgi:hypothetical protein